MTTIADLASLDYKTAAADHQHEARLADRSAIANDELAVRHQREGRPAFARKCAEFADRQRIAAENHRTAAEILVMAARAETS